MQAHYKLVKICQLYSYIISPRTRSSPRQKLFIYTRGVQTQGHGPNLTHKDIRTMGKKLRLGSPDFMSCHLCHPVYTNIFDKIQEKWYLYAVAYHLLLM
jgi:hypothetical protein